MFAGYYKIHPTLFLSPPSFPFSPPPSPRKPPFPPTGKALFKQVGGGRIRLLRQRVTIPVFFFSFFPLSFDVPLSPLRVRPRGRRHETLGPDLVSLFSSPPFFFSFPPPSSFLPPSSPPRPGKRCTEIKAMFHWNAFPLFSFFSPFSLFSFPYASSFLRPARSSRKINERFENPKAAPDVPSPSSSFFFSPSPSLLSQALVTDRTWQIKGIKMQGKGLKALFSFFLFSPPFWSLFFLVLIAQPRER